MHFLKRKGDLLDRSVYDILHISFMAPICEIFCVPVVLRNGFDSVNCKIVILINVI